jgi:hypothetical protein
MIRWKPFLYVAATVSAVAVIGAFSAKPVIAQIRAALVQNVDEPGRNPYQETQFVICAAQNCNFTFATVPAGKRLVLTHVNGTVNTAGGTVPITLIQSSLGGSPFATVWVPLTKSTVHSNATRFMISSDVLAYFGPGEQPSGFDGLFSTPDSFVGGAQLMLTGYYVNLP